MGILGSICSKDDDGGTKIHNAVVGPAAAMRLLNHMHVLDEIGALEEDDDVEAPQQCKRNSDHVTNTQQLILESSKAYVSVPNRQPVYMGSATRIDYHGLLYFDTGTTGTRPYVFMYKSGETQLSEFWALTRAKEMQNITIHTALQGAKQCNEEILKQLGTASDEQKIQLLEGLKLSDDFISYIHGTITQANKIVNKWVIKEQEKGVTFWSDGSAILIADVFLGITGGLRSFVGESSHVRGALAAHMTAYITNKLLERYALNRVRLTAQLFTGIEEAVCEAAAVTALTAMHGSLGARVGVVSMGGASVQITVGSASISVSVARKAGIAAAEKYVKGDAGAMEEFIAKFNKALKDELDAYPGMLSEPRTWVGMSGVFYVARDLALTLESARPLADVRALLPEKMRPLMVAGSESRFGSATACAAVLSNLSGQVLFQREWSNPRTHQKLAATVSTGYMVRRLGYLDS